MNAPVVFPVVMIPPSASDARLIGLYPQRQPERWMQRVRIPGGRMTPAQWRAVADIAEGLTPDTPVHLTTRQDLELHDLTKRTVPEAQSLLAKAGLTGLGACGDTLRNVTVCPCSGVSANAPDLQALADETTDLLMSQEEVFRLPRKFKISLSACADGCGQPWINDLGLQAAHNPDGWKIRAIVAGSLGARPATGIAFPRLLDPGEVPPLALAAVRVFLAHGDREHRHKARLRHVRERLGNDAFLKLLDLEFNEILRSRNWPVLSLTEPVSIFTHSRRLHFPGGNLSAPIVRALGTLAEHEDLCLRIANHHQIRLWGRDETEIGDRIAQAGLERYVSAGPRIVACPGARQCARGLADTQQLAAAIAERLGGSVVGDLLIGISGCPNGCAHSAVADIGLIGGITGSKSNRDEIWNLLAYGQRGQGPGLSRAVASRLSLNDAASQMAQLAIEITAGQAGTVSRFTDHGSSILGKA